MAAEKGCHVEVVHCVQLGGMHQKMELRSTGKGQTKCEATQQAQGPSQLRNVTAGAQ